MMRLGVGHLQQALVHLLRGRLHFRERRVVVLVRLKGGRFVAHLQVHVDELVRERGEFVAEAHRIDSADL